MTGFQDARHLSISWAIRMGFFLCLLLCTALQGCTINRERASVSPDVDLANYKKFYVAKFAPDKRGINNLIATELNTMGLEASTGLESLAPKDVDAIVTYRDRWQWDITMYMIELRVFIRDPQTNTLIAVGNSFHTSLSRKAPEAMVAEVLANIFGQAKKASQAR
jgi:hypothetical protein